MHPEIRERSFFIANLLQQQLIGIFFLLILWELFKNSELNNLGTWHIVLSVFGVAVCLVEATVIFNKSGILKGADRTTKSKYHGALMFVGFLSVTIGVSLKLYQKDSAKRKHFTTTHGILGLTTWLLIILVTISGPFLSQSKQLSHLIRPVVLKGIHFILGIVTYLLGTVTIGYGLDYLSGYTGEHGKIALLVFLSVIILSSLVGPLVSSFNLFVK